MLLEKINEHYEKIIIDHFEYMDLELTEVGIFIDDETNVENIIKLHKICKKIPSDLILLNIETILLLGSNPKLPFNVLKLIDEYQFRFKEKYFLDICKENELYKFSFYHKEYEYKIYTFSVAADNIDLINENIEIFISKEIKLPDSIIERILNDIQENFISGYDINFDNYRKELILASRSEKDKNDYLAIFTNINSGNQIIIHPIQLNEGTGDVFFAGMYNSILKS